MIFYHLILFILSLLSISENNIIMEEFCITSSCYPIVQQSSYYYVSANSNEFTQFNRAAEDGKKWLLTHNYNHTGQLVNDLQLGDVVSVDGVDYVIVDIIVDENVNDLYYATGNDGELIIQTCYDDDVNLLLIVIGEKVE